MGVCSVAYAFIDSPYWLAIARSLVGVGFACTLLASVLSVREIVPLALQATGQALYQSVSFGLAVATAVGQPHVARAKRGAQGEQDRRLPGSGIDRRPADHQALAPLRAGEGERQASGAGRAPRPVHGAQGLDRRQERRGGRSAS